jgi:hypothetical protein
VGDLDRIPPKSGNLRVAGLFGPEWYLRDPCLRRSRACDEASRRRKWLNFTALTRPENNRGLPVSFQPSDPFEVSVGRWWLCQFGTRPAPVRERFQSIFGGQAFAPLWRTQQFDQHGNSESRARRVEPTNLRPGANRCPDRSIPPRAQEQRHRRPLHQWLPARFRDCCFRHRRRQNPLLHPIRPPKRNQDDGVCAVGFCPLPRTESDQEHGNPAMTRTAACHSNREACQIERFNIPNGTFHLAERSPSGQLCSFIATDRRFYGQVKRTRS